MFKIAGAGITMALLVFAINMAIWAAIIWAGGSAITSGIKTAKDDCGKTYGIEKVLDGDWFCSTK